MRAVKGRIGHSLKIEEDFPKRAGQILPTPP
jgi:hypothetical protein